MKGRWLKWVAVPALIISGLVSCGGHSTADPVNVGIKVSRRSENGVRSFLVTWKIENAAKAVAFSRPLGLRASAWQPVDPSLHFTLVNGRELLEGSIDRTEFTVRIDEKFIESIADYPFLTRFSDGGVVLYTGYLETIPVQCLGKCNGGDVDNSLKGMGRSSFRMSGLPGEKVISTSAGASAEASAEIVVTPPIEGELVYFGKQAVRSREGFSVILDPSLPGWIDRELARIVPKILNLNAKKLGRTPGEPLVFLPYLTDSQAGNYVQSGSVVGKSVMLTLYGLHWQRRTAEALGDFRKFVAHESFHLWNGFLYHNISHPETRWLHEGSADEFAYLSLNELGLLSDTQLANLHAEALNRCILGLLSVTLPASVSALEIRNHYNCGSAIEAMLASSLEKRDTDLWSFWSKFFDRTAAKEGFYEPSDFYSLIAEITQDEVSVANFGRITTGDVGGPGQDARALETFFFGAFRAVGLSLVASDDGSWPDWYSKLVLERALLMAMQADCGTDGYIVSQLESVRMVGAPSCRFMKSNLEITEIAGKKVWTEGAQAYDKIRIECDQAAFFKIAGPEAREALNMGCPKLPRRPRYLRLNSTLP